MDKRRLGKPQIILFAGAIAINFVLPRLASHFNVPLYLDNIGTLLAAVLGGYLPGIAVGYLNNIITSIIFNRTGSVMGVLIASTVTITIPLITLIIVSHYEDE